MLDVRDIGMEFGQKSLFKNVNLILLPSQRYGVVGANGTGKSTFLKLLSCEIKINNPLKWVLINSSSHAIEIISKWLVGSSNNIISGF